MSPLTMRPDARPEPATSQPISSPAFQPPRREDEGLSAREIKWIPVLVPLAALTMLLGAALVLSTA